MQKGISGTVQTIAEPALWSSAGDTLASAAQCGPHLDLIRLWFVDVTYFRAAAHPQIGAGDREARLRIFCAIRLCPVRLQVDWRQAAPDSVSRFPLALKRALFSIRADWKNR
jgi:hypothetical protein